MWAVLLPALCHPGVLVPKEKSHRESEDNIRATGASCSQSLPFFVRKLSTPANLQEGVSWVKMAAVPWPYPYTWAGDTATVGGKNVLKCWVGSR